MKKQPINKFLIIFLFLKASVLLNAEEIGTAFGVTLGKEFPKTIPTISTSTNGAIVFHDFKPNNVKYIESVMTVSFVTDKTNYVCSIGGVGKFQSKLDQDEAADILKDLLSAKYMTSTSRKKESAFRKTFSIEQGSRSVSIKKEINLSNFPRAYQISVDYGDEVLAQQVLDYQKQLKLKQTKSDSF
jgi:hypothetical protein